MRRVYLDSCIVIYLIQASDSVRDEVSKALRGSAQDSVPQPFVSELTRLECRVWPLRKNETVLLAAFDRFFASGDLAHVDLSREVFELATELRAELGIKTPDALHCAAAIQSGCHELWTNDHRLPRALEERISIRILP